MGTKSIKSTTPARATKSASRGRSKATRGRGTKTGGPGDGKAVTAPKKVVGTAGRGSRKAVKAPARGSLIGRRVGHGKEDMLEAADRPEKRRRDEPVDTAKPGVSATDRKAGGGSTARRNARANTKRATRALEDSAKDTPSRKSTRKSANRVKGATQLQRRQVRAIRAPKVRAAKASARKAGASRSPR